MSEKTEQPTAQKIRQARKDGDVAKSAEFTGVVVMLTALSVSMITMKSMGMRMMELMRRSITMISSEAVPNASSLGGYLFEALTALGWILAPLLAATCTISAGLTYLQTGAIFTLKPLNPDPTRLDPFKGLKNILNKDKIVELVKNILKLSIMIWIGFIMLKEAIITMIPTPQGSLPHGMLAMGDAAWRLTSYMLGALIVFGVADILWQRHKYTKKLMMSKDEIKQQYKQSEGDPQLKGKRKQLHQEMLRDASMHQVKKADAVVVNPTHIAVAIQYDAETMDAPCILVSGRGDRAKHIKALAKKHRIPIVKQIPLARALVDLDLDSPIPEDFYEAMAEILRFVYSLRKHD